MSDYKVVRDEKLSTKYESRYVVVDAETGKVLDDAQGYGYKSVRGAHASWSYKNRSPEKKAHDAAAKNAVRRFLKKHPDVEDALVQAEWEIVRGDYGSDVQLNAKMVKGLLEDMGYTDLPFTPSELLKYS